MDSSHVPSKFFLLNCAALLKRNARLEKKIRAFTDTRSISHYRESAARKSGISMQLKKDNQWKWIYSAIDPLLEAHRQAERIPPAHLFVCLGIGNGYILEILIKRFPHADFLVFEPDLAYFYHALSGRNLLHIIAHPSIHIFEAASHVQVCTLLKQQYLGVLHGKAHFIGNHSLITNLKIWSTMAHTLQAQLSALASDLALYRKLGRCWIRNMLLNGIHLSTPQQKLAHLIEWDDDVVITAAGPSLQTYIAHAKHNTARTTNHPIPQKIIATDSSLPALLRNAIVPHCVVSIDCQLATYLHFMDQGAKDIPLIADLSISPSILRSHRSFVCARSNHPFAVLVAQYFPHMQTLVGEHVTHAALNYALASAPHAIQIGGADFCYWQGKAYINDAYLTTYFHNRAHRLNPAEYQSLQFTWKQQSADSVYRDGIKKIKPDFFARYERQLMQTISESPNYRAHNADALLPYTVQRKSHISRAALVAHTTATPPQYDWKQFLHAYKAMITSLPQVSFPLLTAISHWSNRHLLTLLTLLPLCEHIADHAHRYGSRKSPVERLAYAKTYTITLIDKTLQSMERHRLGAPAPLHS